MIDGYSKPFGGFCGNKMWLLTGAVSGETQRVVSVADCKTGTVHS